MPEKNLCQGRSLHDAARTLNIPFTKEQYPEDRQVVAGGLNFHYLDWGSKSDEPILLLHGIAQQAHSWDLVSLALSDRYRVVALDARGHGDTQWPSNQDYSIEAHQGDLDVFVEAIGLDKFILVGHSMGGRNGYVFTSRRTEKVKALVIVDIGPDGERSGSQRIRRFVTLPDQLDSFEEFVLRVQEYTGRPLWMINGSLKHSVKQLPSGKWTWKYDKAIRNPNFSPGGWTPEDLWGCLDRIKCPVFVVRGANSDIFSNDTLEHMLRAIPGSKGTVIPDSGHLVVGDNTVGFIEAVEDFLSTLG